MSAYECFLESTYNLLSSAIMKDGSSNNYLMARLPVRVSAYFRIWLCCMEPKSLTTNGPTHRGHTCRSLDATFSPNPLYAASFVRLWKVSQSIPDQLVRHKIQPWSSFNQPEFGRQRRFIGMGT